MRLSWISAIVTLLILYVAITRLDWLSLWNALFVIDLNFVALAFGAWIVLMLLKGFKWKCILRSLNGKVSLWESVRVLWIGLFVGVITPGRVGDFVRVAYVKDTVSIGEGILAVFVDRALDVLTLVAFAVVGLFFLASSTGIHLLSNELIAVLVLVCVGGLILLLNKRFVKKVILPILLRVIPASFSGVLQRYGKQFYGAIPLMQKNKRWIGVAFVLSIATWIGAMAFGYFFLRALGLSLDFSVALLVVPIISLVEIIPIGIAGIGTRELAAVVVLGAYGVSPENAVLFSLLYFAAGYIPSFLIGAFLFNRYPLPLNTVFQQFFPKKEKAL